MKPSTRDKIKSERDKIKGKVKEGLGKLAGNPNFEEGENDDHFKGKEWEEVGVNKKGLTHSLLPLLGALVWVALSLGLSCRANR